MKGVQHNFFLTLTLLLVLAMPALTMSAHADDDEDTIQNDQNLKVVDHGTVKLILKSDMIMLDDDKRYRLENILVPPFEDPPAVDELKREFLNKPVTIYAYHEVEEDQQKYGVPYAHVVTTKGVWLQQDLISKGLAWALCTETSPQTIDVLKQAEEKARVDHQGFWKDPAYAIKGSDNIGDFIDSYQIVEGRISSVATSPTSNLTYFNFGRGKKPAFKVKFMNDQEFRSFLNDPITGEASEKGIKQWKGREVRIRGWVRDEGGPEIVMTRKQQLDIVMLSDQ